jgi:uncharacterized membrane protein affecting hemolysin expression
MKFDRFSHKDDALFVMALLLPALIAGARFFKSEHEMDQIAQARQHATMLAGDHRPPADLRIAVARNEAR